MKNPIPFVFQETRDGSPSLSLGQGGEWMHHRGGAFSETTYVYGDAVDKAMEGELPRRFLSVGLGLGYVEVLIAARSFQKREGAPFFIQSFEADSLLRQYFLSWLRSEKVPADFHGAYDRILNCTAQANALHPAGIKNRLLEWHQSGQWEIQATLDAYTKWDHAFGAILYDAFSSETSPELWKSSFLDKLLGEVAGTSCVFATYASTGELKRCLRRHRFGLFSKKGFQGKRECTLAVRSGPRSSTNPRITRSTSSG